MPNLFSGVCPSASVNPAPPARSAGSPVAHLLGRGSQLYCWKKVLLASLKEMLAVGFWLLRVTTRAWLATWLSTTPLFSVDERKMETVSSGVNVASQLYSTG